MSTINRLSSVDVLQPGDQIPVWDSSNGDTRKASMTTLLAFVESYFADPDYSTRIVAPAVDYFTVDIGATGDSIWMIVNPTLNFTNGAITLPPASSAVNDQEITVVFTAAVSTFVITSAGATVLGAPVQIGGYDSFRVRYNSAQLTWYTLDTTGDGTGSGVSQIVRQDFTGNGTTTTFTLTTAPSGLGNELQIFIDGVYQERAGYTVTGSNVVFSEAPPSLSTIEVLGWSVTLGAETSANLVSYTPAGTGAVLTTAQAKLRESVSVLDFGAVGDGVADDTAAIQAAIDSFTFVNPPLNGVGGGIIRVPAGQYRLVGTLTVSNSGIKFEGDGSKASVFECENAGTTITYSDPDQTDIAFGRFSMSRMAIRATSVGAKATGKAIHMTSVFDTVWEDLEVHYFPTGLDMYTCYFNTFIGCMWHTCLTEGVRLRGGVDNCVGNNFIGGSFRLSSVTDEGDGTSFEGLDFEPMFPGRVIEFGGQSRVENCYFETGGTYNFTQTNNLIRLQEDCTFANNIIAWSVDDRPNDFLISVVGDRNKIYGNQTSYIDRVFQLETTSSGNDIVFNAQHNPVASGINEYAAQPVLDLGFGNEVKYVSPDGAWTKDSGIFTNLTKVESNRASQNFVRTPAEQTLNNLTVAASTAIADPFGGDSVSLCTINSAANGTLSYTPAAYTADGLLDWCASAYIYLPTGTTVTNIMICSGVYGIGRYLTVSALPKDRWLRITQVSRPGNTLSISPAILTLGPVGGVFYVSHFTLYDGAIPLTPTTNSVFNQIAEKARSSDGAWKTPTFNAADYTSNAGTLTVASGDVTTFRYQIKDNTMTMILRLDAMALAGSNAATINIKIPEGRLAKHVTLGPISVNPAGGPWSTGFAATSVGGSQVIVYTNPAATGWIIGDNSLMGSLIIELQ